MSEADGRDMSRALVEPLAWSPLVAVTSLRERDALLPLPWLSETYAKFTQLPFLI